jgi:hypothetical protein
MLDAYVQIEWNELKNVILEAAIETLGENQGKEMKTGLTRSVERLFQNNMREIMLQRMTRSSKESYREQRTAKRC